MNAGVPVESFVQAISPDGKSRRLPPSASHSDAPGAALIWRHIDGNDAECRKWLETESGLAKGVVAALEAAETRPRATALRGGVLVVLRGVNENPDADPEDLVSIRLWVTARTVLSMNFRPLLAVPDMQDVIKQRVVKDVGDFIVELAGVLTRRIDSTLDDLSASLDVLEDDVIEERGKHLRRRIGAVRRAAIELRRYISPQRDALLQLANGPFDFFDDSDRSHLAEAGQSVTRIIEEIDSVRDQAAVLSDQLSDLRAETVGQRTLVLSIVAAVFLPLTYITGLIGMNVAGIPYARETWAFAAVVAANLAIAGAIALWLYRRGWFK